MSVLHITNKLIIAHLLYYFLSCTQGKMDIPPLIFSLKKNIPPFLTTCFTSYIIIGIARTFSLFFIKFNLSFASTLEKLKSMKSIVLITNSLHFF